MGNILILFDPKKVNRSSGMTRTESGPAFDEFANEGVAFAFDSFLLPPLDLFGFTRARLGLSWYRWISWNEETLAALLFIESMIISEHPARQNLDKP
jgi:hypothetical protein